MWKKYLPIVLLFFAATFLTYGSSLRNEFVTWDDPGLIFENPNVMRMNPRTIATVFTSYDPELFVPLTFVSYQIDHLIGGLNPFVYHLTNLILHTVNALLVTWFLFLLLGSPGMSIVLGLLFALHPLNTEAVAWASARKDVLSTLFFLASLISFIRWREESGRGKYVASLVFFLLGLLSKVMVITLPLVLILMDMLEGRKMNRKVIVEKLPYFFLAFIFGIVSYFGKAEILVASTPLQKILMAMKSTAFYLKSFVLPTNLSVHYPYTKPITFTSLDFWIPAGIVIILLGLIGWYWRRTRLLSIGILFFLTTLIPTFFNFAKGGDIYFASDRYAYIPMIGLLLVLGFGMISYLRATSTPRIFERNRRIVFGSVTLILLIAAAGSYAQAKTWATSTALFENALASYPNARAAHHNLAMELLGSGDAEGALKQFDLATALKDDPRTRVSYAAALVALKRYDEALAVFRDVMKLYPSEPDAYYGVGNVYYRQGKLKEATEQYRIALEKRPEYVNALNNLGAVSIELQDWDAAIHALERSIALKPDFAESYYNLGGVYEETGRKEEAERMYSESLTVKPDDADALSRLATLVYDRGEIDEAATLLQKALDVDSSNPTARALILRMKSDGVAE